MIRVNYGSADKLLNMGFKSFPKERMTFLTSRLRGSV
jgi:hypothetical protein